jgi:DNA-binding YbaB/EbfC family protein
MKMMKQAQELQSKAARLQADLAARQYQGSSGGGAVTVVTNGECLPLSIKIDPAILKDGDVEALEDLIITALREAVEKGKKEAAAEMQRLTAGLGLPGM